MKKNAKWIPLKDMEDQIEFWKGTRFRKYGIGLNVADKKDDYYEYMLAEIPGERGFMLLTCVEAYKSGSALALVKTTEDPTKFTVKVKDIQYAMGIESTFLKITYSKVKGNSQVKPTIKRYLAGHVKSYF